MSDSGMTVKPAVAATPPAVNAQPAAAPAGKTPAVQATVGPKQAPPPSVDIEAVAKQLENFLKRVSRELEFHVDGSSGRVVCSVRDSQTGDLIRQQLDDEVLTPGGRLDHAGDPLTRLVERRVGRGRPVAHRLGIAHDPVKSVEVVGPGAA